MKSGTNPETPWKRSQSKFCISRFRTVGDPQTLENKADSLSQTNFGIVLPPVRLGPFPFFGRAPSMEQPELVMKFLTVLGAHLRHSLSHPPNEKPGNHPNFRENALGVKRPFSELWERSGAFSEQLSGFENNSRNAKSHSRNGVSRLVQYENHNSRNNSRSDSRN